MKKIKLLYIIPFMVLMFAVFNLKINAFDHINNIPEHNDIFNIVYIDNDNQKVYLGLVAGTEDNAIIYTVEGNHYEEISLQYNVGDYVYFNENYGGYLSKSSPLVEDNIVWYISHNEMTNGITVIKVYHEQTNKYYSFNGEQMPIGVPKYRINRKGLPYTEEYDLDLYNNALEKGRREMQEYYESLLPDLLNEEFQRGRNQGFQEAYENISDDLPEWVIKSTLKVNDSLYNRIDYDNLIFYENVGYYEPSRNDYKWVEYIYTNTVMFAIDLPSNAIPRSPIGTVISNKLPYILNYTDVPHFFFHDNVVYVYINKNELSTFDVNGWEEWLLTNNFSITYELREKTAYIIPQNEINQLPFYNYGLADGYTNGYKDSAKNVNAVSVFVPSIIGSIWIVIVNFLSFEIFGISLWWLLGVIVMVTMVIFVIRVIRQ